MLCWQGLFCSWLHPQYKIQRRRWHPTPALLPGKSHGQRSLVGCSPWGCKESDPTERLHFPFSLSHIGEGNGDPLQCSCLENPRDSGAWWAAVYEVAQSRTQLKRLSSNLAVLRQDTLLLYNPCKDQTYSHNLHFKITELARRFNPETVLR